MRTKHVILSIAAGIIATSLTFSPASAKKNIFKRAANSMREFFSDDKKEDNDATQQKTEPTGKVEPTHTDTDKYDANSATELYDLSFEENKMLPKLGGQRAKVREYQQIQAKKLLVAGQSIETTRNGEVILATIAASDLFLPNDTVLRPSASKILRQYTPFLKEPDFYRMLILMHSDDTGSETYTNRLTMTRVMAVLDWFKKESVCSDYIIPYAMGADDPLPNTPNNSFDNRDKNRRLEIYLVPGKAMIKKSSRGQLK